MPKIIALTFSHGNTRLWRELLKCEGSAPRDPAVFAVPGIFSDYRQNL